MEYEKINFWEIADRTKLLGHCWVNSHGIIERATPRFAEIVGRDALDLEGMSVAAITHSDDLGSTRKRLKRLLDGEQPSDRVITQKVYVTPTGRRVFCKLEALALRDDRNIVRGVLSKIVEVIDGEQSTKVAELEAELHSIRELVYLLRNQGVHMTVGDTHTNTQSADRGGRINSNDSHVTNSQKLMIAVVVVLGLVVVVLLAMVLGGYVHIDGGGVIDVSQ